MIAQGIEFEVVPGITAALAAGSYAGVPITHRDYASAVALVTGQEADDKAGLTLDYGRLAQFPGTLVVYMGVTTARAVDGGAGAGRHAARDAGGDYSALQFSGSDDGAVARWARSPIIWCLPRCVRP